MYSAYPGIHVFQVMIGIKLFNTGKTKLELNLDVNDQQVLIPILEFG
jgi:hypothetical protein